MASPAVLLMSIAFATAPVPSEGFPAPTGTHVARSTQAEANGEDPLRYALLVADVVGEVEITAVTEHSRHAVWTLSPVDMRINEMGDGPLLWVSARQMTSLAPRVAVGDRIVFVGVARADGFLTGFREQILVKTRDDFARNALGDAVVAVDPGAGVRVGRPERLPAGQTRASWDQAKSAIVSVADACASERLPRTEAAPQFSTVEAQ